VHIDEGYSKPMKISIPSVQIADLHITPNVNSYDEVVYNESLKKGAGHFKGTPLPGDGGNSFIYGHSTVESFFSSNKNSPEIAFTKLEKVKFGDTFSIEKDGNTFIYTVKQIKKVPANDFSVLESQNKETVTLMTCWPLGIGSERLIVIAERYE
jgi:sortase A